VNNYFYCRIPLEGLLCDVERELLARAKFLLWHLVCQRNN